MSPEELKLERQRLAVETALRRADQDLARKQFEFQRTQSIQSTPSGWKALMTPTGGILLAATLGLLGTAVGKWADNTIETNKQQTAIILRASEVLPTLSADEQIKLRARNLLWFEQAQYITLPAAFVADLRSAAKLGEGQAVPPPAILSAATAPIDRSVPPNYSIPVPPAAPGQTKAAYKLLQIAVGELNANVHEGSNPQRILKYWTATPSPLASIKTPWSAVFISWLINGAAPGQMKLSPSVMELRSAAEQAGLMLKAERPLPGDIVLISATSGGPAAIAGVVHSFDGDRPTVISGNVADAVHLRLFPAQNVVGYFRLKD